MIENILKILSKYGYMFGDGVKYTLLLSLVTVAFGSLLGSLIALMKMSKVKPVSWLASIYIEVMRGTPLLLQLYFFYFGLTMFIPFLNRNKLVCVALALMFNSAAYVSEIVRSGIQAVDRGQTEAARSLGMNSTQTMLRIVLPQAIKNILPALCNEFVMVIKETSLASTFFIGDIMTQYSVINGFTYMVIEPLIIAGLIYFILTFTLSKAIAVFERRMKASD